MRNLIIHHRPMLCWAVAVFVLAVLIRLPSCYESFWVDELHTAWAIWGDFVDVSPRAAAGNQTPLYFGLMWCWKAIVGESEVALRLSSVLALALGSALLVVGVKHTTGRLSAGVLAGAILAIESNAVFFGTEFRPYALVMLLSVVATWAAVCLLLTAPGARRGSLRLVFIAAVSLAALIHPTSVVTLGTLAAAVLVVQVARFGVNLKFQISDVVSLAMVATVAFSWANSSLGHSWENRSQWRAFGQATSLQQLWTIWPWVLLAIVPALIAILMLWRESVRNIAIVLMPLAVGSLATFVFFVASYYDWVPLWHRRYFVAVLPMLAWSAGACMSLLPSTKFRTEPIDCLVAGFLLASLFWQQGTLTQWQRGQTQLVFRGEDWRGAVQWVASQRGDGETVMVDAGLIEDKRLFDLRMRGRLGLAGDNAMINLLEEYLAFPVAGPYAIEGTKPAEFDYWTSAIPPRIDLPAAEEHGWVISRSGQQRFHRWLENASAVLLESHKFGNVSVFKVRPVHNRIAPH